MSYNDAVAVNVSKDKIQDFAEFVSTQLDYNGSDDIFDIVEALGGSIDYEKDFAEYVDASVFIEDTSNFKILLPEHTSVAHDLTSIAHELGHFFIHFLHQKVALKANRGGVGQAEKEADWFASAFLMPREKFLTSVKKHDGSVIAIAEEFGVTIHAVHERSVDLEITI